MTHPITPSQTIGPFSHEAWRWACELPGSGPLTISGIIRDGDGVPVTDAMIEAWSPGAALAEPSHALPGFRRCPSNDEGAFHFALPRGRADAGEPAALITIFARGLVLHQCTAIFLEDDAGLAASKLLGQVPAERRATLVARKAAGNSYVWDIWMQGPQETVFFDYRGAP